MKSIGRYEIIGELGRGAMGIVYHARDSRIGRDVAVKTIHLRDLADDAERQRLRDRLLREAQSAGILSHPNIVTIYDVAEEGEIAYIAMECVDGTTLDRLMAAEPLEGKLVLSILTQTAAALDFAHKRGIVHRDIKPANIMIHERKTAKITDFGVARLLSHQMTQVGSMVGTPNYMSPEQIQTKPVDGRSDQFSLAVIAYELLTGEKPFAADSIAALAYRIVREPALPAHRLNPTLDWPVDTVLQRALSKEPEARYPTCSDFAFALENACRACKKWQPLRTGAAQDIATSFEAAAPVIPPAPVSVPKTVAPVKKKPAPPPAALSKPVREEPPERPPLFLRMVRLLALVVLGGGLIAALLVSAVRWLDERNQQPVAQTTPPAGGVAETATPPAKKPSAMPTLPGEATSTPQETPDQKQEPETPEPPPAQPKPAPAAVPNSIDTRLITNPPGAFLVVDGTSTLSCQSPCTLTLAKGRHTLAATMQGFRRTLRIFESPHDSEVFLNLDRASGTLAVRSEPRGADIYVNGQARSEKTPALLTLPAGSYSLELVLDGQRQTQQVQVHDSAITNIAVQFNR